METSMWRATSADLNPSHPGQYVASMPIEIALASGVNAPRQSSNPVTASSSAFHGLMLCRDSLDSAETRSIPATPIRNRSKAAPGNPAGNIEKSRCTAKSYLRRYCVRMTHLTSVSLALLGQLIAEASAYDDVRRASKTIVAVKNGYIAENPRVCC
jgi:hypothetical protein